MTRHVTYRLAQAVGVLWAAYSVSFLVLHALPGDPVAASIGGDSSDVTPAQIAALRAQYGLDKPLPVQYVQQLWHVLHGDLGRSVGTGRPVVDLIVEAIGPTAQIAGAALFLAVVLGGGLALVATAVRSRALESFLLSLPSVGVAIPSFWFGLLLVQVLSFTFPVFPAVGNKGVASVVLPAVTLALPTGALIAQILATSLRRTLREPYIDTARAKGAGRVRVHLRHALRNAALPALTVTGLVVGGLLSGAVVTETVFGRAGLGRLTATAVGSHDTAVVQGLVIFGALVFVTVNLVVDLIYPVLDPRILTARPARRKWHGTSPAPVGGVGP